MTKERDFFLTNSGKSLSDIAEAQLYEIMEGGDINDIKKANILLESTKLAEQMIKDSKEGDANVHFTAAVIAAIMMDITPHLLARHLEAAINDAILLRRIHDPHFNEKMEEYQKALESGADYILHQIDKARKDDKVH